MKAEFFALQYLGGGLVALDTRKVMVEHVWRVLQNLFFILVLVAAEVATATVARMTDFGRETLRRLSSMRAAI